MLNVGMVAVANPVDPFRTNISELFFDESNHWYLELSLPYFYAFEDLRIDSVSIKTNDNISTMIIDTSQQLTGIIVITQDSLISDLAINNLGDVLSVKVYFYNRSFIDDTTSRIAVLRFGNVSDSYIDNIRDGQSIVSMCRPLDFGCRQVFSKDNSPTIGNYNDTAGVCGYLYGKVYNLNGVIVADSVFTLDNEFSTDISGNYKAAIFSGNYSEKYIYWGEWNSNFSEFSAFNSMIEPEVHYPFDIYLLDSVFVGIPKPENNLESSFKLYPNPTVNNITIEGNISTNSIISIYDIVGKKIYSERIAEDKSIIHIELNRIFVPGIYILSIVEKNKQVFNQQIVINTFK